ALGLAEEAPSPTFAIVQSYARPEVCFTVAHVDLYRIHDPDDATERGLDELLEDGALLIECPERLGEALWSHALRLTLTPDARGGRRLTWDAPSSWEARWPPR